MNKKEADFGLLFRHWIKANPIKTGSIELKQTTADSILFSCVEQEQIDYALAIESSKGVLIRTTGVTGLPDYIWIRKEPAYIVIRYPNFFCMIRIKKFLKEKNDSQRKSLTSTRARSIAYLFVMV